MKAVTVAILVACSGSTAMAGTLGIDWIGGPTQVVDYQYSMAPEIYTVAPVSRQFLFEVSDLHEPVFDFAFDAPLWRFSGASVVNPYDATLLSRPDGHLGGYDDISYAIRVRPGSVELRGYLADHDDILTLTPTRVVEDDNRGMRIERSSGYWSASYIPDDISDGRPFTVAPESPAPVPAPAAMPLLLAGLMAFGGIAGRRRRAARDTA